MSKELLTCTKNTHISGAAALLIARKIGSLVVVEGKHLAGLITKSDLLK